MESQPTLYIGMFVGGIIVGNEMDLFVGSGFAVDLAQKGNPIG